MHERYVEGWGWGTWKNRWAKFRYFQTKQEALCLLSEKDRKQLEFNGAFPCLHNLDLSPIPWDICWYISVYLNKGVYITVKQSLTKNIGLASGIHFSKTFLQRILSKNIYATKLSTDLITEFTTNTTPNIEAELEFSKYQLNYNNSTCIHYIWNRFKKVTKKTIRISQTLKALILRRPVSRIFGTERGTPIDRFYIEDFLQKNSNAIHGDVLEIAENTYTLKYGHAPLNSHILHVSSDNSNATLIGNLETGENIPVNSFDCIILTQTLPFIYDVRAVLKHSYLALKPNGTLLLTLPLIAQISRYDMDRWGDYWRFTDLAALRLLQEFFQKDKIVITVYGNYYAASSFLAGMALEDINRKRLFPTDHDYQLILGAIAGK